MAKRRVSNLLALAVLGSVVERPMHPYEISTTLRSRGKEQSIKLNFGSLYTVVEALAKHGLIEAQETVREGRRPERTIYAITDAGRAEFEDWLSELLSTPTPEYTSLAAALSFVAGLSPDQVVTLLSSRATRLRMDLGAVDAGLAYTSELGLPEVFVVEEEYRRALMQAELDFVTGLAERISSGSLGGVAAWRRLHELTEEGHSFEDIVSDPEKYLGKEGAVLAPFLNPQ